MTYEVWDTGYLAERRFLSDLGFLDGATLLLVGVKTYREWPFHQHVIATGGRVMIVEPFTPNAEWATRAYPEAKVFQTTIQDFLAVPHAEHPTVVIWLQGPEHVDKATALSILESLASRAMVIAEMPHGIHEQGPDGGNPMETHRSYLYPSDFDESRWNIAVGPKDLPREQSPDQNQHLLVWSR